MSSLKMPWRSTVPRSETHAGGGVAGEVARIYPTGFTKISSLGVEQQRVRVIIQFAPACWRSLPHARDLGVDYQVRVRIFTAQQEDALVVPRSALFEALTTRGTCSPSAEAAPHCNPSRPD